MTAETILQQYDQEDYIDDAFYLSFRSGSTHKRRKSCADYVNRTFLFRKNHRKPIYVNTKTKPSKQGQRTKVNRHSDSEWQFVVLKLE